MFTLPLLELLAHFERLLSVLLQHKRPPVSYLICANEGTTPLRVPSDALILIP